MFPSIDFVLATTAIVTLIVGYVLVLAKLGASDGSSEDEAFPLIPQSDKGNSSKQRRMEILERIKEEKIREYYSRRNRKTDDS